jgi:two-component system chemotaxis response regulator CheY
MRHIIQGATIMIIIEQKAEERLIQLLEQLKIQPKSLHAMVIAISKFPIPEEEQRSHHNTIKQYLTTHSKLEKPYIFLCSDQDIIVIASAISNQLYREIGADLFNLTQTAKLEAYIQHHDLSLETPKLLALIQPKWTLLCQNQQQQKKQQEDAENKRKQDDILNLAIPNQWPKLIDTRKQRTKPDILIVEDDLFSRRLVDNVLRRDYALTSVGDGRTALEHYLTHLPNMIFLDIDLPDISGHLLLKKIITIDPDAYIIMLSGNGDKKNVMQAIENGAKGFVAKPFTKEKLLHYIERCPNSQSVRAD